jgi:hypothetical protein
MRTCVTTAVLLALPAACLADEAKGKAVEFKAYTKPYFEKNTSGLKGEASFLAVTDQAGFDKVFGVGFTMGPKPDMLAKDAFDKKMVVATIKRGNSITTYNVEKVTADGDTLYVQYKSETKDGGGASFASPLIVAVDKGKYASVVFIENGKTVGKAEIGK